MIEEKDLNIIKKATEEFFDKMTISAEKIEAKQYFNSDILDSKELLEQKDAVLLKIALKEPQILIGQAGQTLFEIQRVLRMMLNKKLQKAFYLDLDINDYKAQKTDYLKGLAKELADQVFLTKETKALNPMSSYERRIIHQELSKRTDIISESQGEGPDRHIIIKPR